MPASKADIRRWLGEARERGATHMIVKCDMWDYRGSPGDACCYPVYVMPDEDVLTIDSDNADTTREVYSMRISDERQLQETRAFHYE